MAMVTHKGGFKNTERFFNRVMKKEYLNVLEKYGQMGVQALAGNTPAQSGKTADSWDFGIDEGDGKVTIYWTNSNENEGINIVLLLIYGHGTENGYYVEGLNFVDPAIQPIFQQMAEETWREITK